MSLTEIEGKPPILFMYVTSPSEEQKGRKYLEKKPNVATKGGHW